MGLGAGGARGEQAPGGRGGGHFTAVPLEASQTLLKPASCHDPPGTHPSPTACAQSPAFLTRTLHPHPS